MPTRVGYIGKLDDAVGWWDYDWRVPIAVNSNHSLTIIPCNYRSGAVSNEDSYALTNDPVVTMDVDEYPTILSFSGYASYVSGFFNLHERDDGSITINLCHSDGWTIYDKTYLTSFAVRHQESVCDTEGHYISNGSVFAGKKLDIYVEGDRQICLRHQCQVNIETDYLAKSISAVSQGNGNISVSSASAKRGGNVTVTVTPAFGYLLDSITASAGLLVQVAENTYTFVMPTPAREVTITASFAAEPHKTVKYHDGTGFVECIPHVYDGSEFKEVEPYYYNGSEWVLCSQT